MANILQNPDDVLEVDPDELGPLYGEVLTNTLAKSLATEAHTWTDKLESELQESISALVAAAKARGLKTFTLKVTRKNGEKVITEIDVDRINRSRSLQ